MARPARKFFIAAFLGVLAGPVWAGADAVAEVGIRILANRPAASRPQPKPPADVRRPLDDARGKERRVLQEVERLRSLLAEEGPLERARLQRLQRVLQEEQAFLESRLAGMVRAVAAGAYSFPRASAR